MHLQEVSTALGFSTKRVESMQIFCKNVLNAFIYFFVFASVATILSQWLGLFFLNTPLIIALSTIFCIALVKKFPFAFELQRKTFLLMFAVAVLCAHPLLLIHPFYPASNDAFHTIMVRLLQMNQKIPQTFEPYAGISFTYTFGFHLFAKLLCDLLPFVPDYLVLWLLGLFFASMQPILIYLFAKELFKSEKAAFYSAILFVGTKMIYQNMFFGMWPRLFAMDLFLLYFIFFFKNNRLCMIFLPALAIVHSGMLFNAVLFSIIYLLFHRENFLPLLKTTIALPLALPSLAISYAPTFLNTFQWRKAEMLPIAELYSQIVSVALWLGWVPLAAVVIGLLWMLCKRKFSKQGVFPLALLSAFLLSYFLLVLIRYPSANVPMEFAGLAAIIFGGLFFADLRFKSKELEKYTKALLVVLCLIAFFSSGYLTKLRLGSKITPEQAKFAFEFKLYDPELKETLFLTPGASKIAEFSNKIPYDATVGFFLPFAEHIVKQDSAYHELVQRAQTQQKILESRCISCIYDLNLAYVVIDEKYFPAKLAKTPVLEHGSIKLYKLK